jgi:hypothetical protein
LYFKLPDIVHSKKKTFFFGINGIDYATDVTSVATASSKDLKPVERSYVYAAVQSHRSNAKQSALKLVVSEPY